MALLAVAAVLFGAGCTLSKTLRVFNVVNQR
jgi:hypothetical protein